MFSAPMELTVRKTEKEALAVADVSTTTDAYPNKGEGGQTKHTQESEPEPQKSPI